MAPASNEEQFKFLISCIRWSNNGRVDFGEVAGECGIVSKGAAAKRYERMMKAHGIAPNAASVKAPPAARAFKIERKDPKQPTKKRKTDAFAEDQGATDDDEGLDNIKPDMEEGSKPRVVKDEESDQLQFEETNNMMQYLPHLGSADEDYDSSGSVYEQATDGYSTPFETYGLEVPSNYGKFASFGESNAEAPQSSGSQMSQRKHESILLGD